MKRNCAWPRCLARNIRAWGWMHPFPCEPKYDATALMQGELQNEYGESTDDDDDDNNNNDEHGGGCDCGCGGGGWLGSWW